jgi:hypothetical protein
MNLLAISESGRLIKNLSLVSIDLGFTFKLIGDFDHEQETVFAAKYCAYHGTASNQPCCGAKQPEWFAGGTDRDLRAKDPHQPHFHRI